jgi:hypothetical protein
MKISVRGQARQKKARENQKTETFSIDARYDLEVSSRGQPVFSFVVHQGIASYDLRIDFRSFDEVGFPLQADLPSTSTEHL